MVLGRTLPVLCTFSFADVDLQKVDEAGTDLTDTIVAFALLESN